MVPRAAMVSTATAATPEAAQDRPPGEEGVKPHREPEVPGAAQGQAEE